MSFAYHGNWCGPGWTARQWKDAKDLTEEDYNVEAIDALDQACKNHDIAIARGDPDAHHTFYRETADLGVSATFARWMIGGFGPPTEAYLRGNEGQPYEISEWYAPENRRRRKTRRNIARDEFMQAFNRTGYEGDTSQQISESEDEYEETKTNEQWVEENFPMSQSLLSIFQSYVTPDRTASQETIGISPDGEIISVENLPDNPQVQRPINPDFSLNEWRSLNEFGEMLMNTPAQNTRSKRQRKSFYILPWRGQVDHEKRHQKEKLAINLHHNLYQVVRVINQ